MKNYALAFTCLFASGIALAADFSADFDIVRFGTSCCYIDESHGRSFMFTRPITHDLEMRNAGWINILYDLENPAPHGFQAIAMYQQSLPDDRTTRYFLPCGKMNVFVSGSGNTGDFYSRDIMAEWLGLGPLTPVAEDGHGLPEPGSGSTFRGSFAINPKQRQMGVILEYKHDLQDWLDLDFFEDTWVDIMIPLIGVTNSVQFQQYDVNPGNVTTYPNDLVQAFNQPSWFFAKFGGQQSTVRISELQAKMGRTYLFRDHFIVGYYSVLSFQTGNKQNPEYIFSPVAGNNGHFGVGAGVNFQLVLNRDTSRYAVCLYADLEGQFLIYNIQYRTYDLRKKPWSRYMLFIRKDGPYNAYIPGVNVLTLETYVQPYNIVDFATGFRVVSDPVEVEVGYGIWGRPDERLELTCPFPSRIYGIASGSDTLTPEGFPATANTSTIQRVAAFDTDDNGDPAFISIKEGDIDLQSAAAKSTLNQKVHASFTYRHVADRFDGFISIGALSDVPFRNTALTNVTAWVKFGATF